MLFKFFQKNNQNDDQPNETLAKISYIVSSKSDSIIVDVELNQYDEECILALCDIVDTLAQKKSLSNTVEIIKTGMTDDGQEDAIMSFISNLDHNTKKILINSYKNTDEPCIKPSDVFLK